jgi:hypothetical protein
MAQQVRHSVSLASHLSVQLTFLRDPTIQKRSRKSSSASPAKKAAAAAAPDGRDDVPEDESDVDEAADEPVSKEARFSDI